MIRRIFAKANKFGIKPLVFPNSLFFIHKVEPHPSESMIHLGESAINLGEHGGSTTQSLYDKYYFGDLVADRHISNWDNILTGEDAFAFDQVHINHIKRLPADPYNINRPTIRICVSSANYFSLADMNEHINELLTHDFLSDDMHDHPENYRFRYNKLPDCECMRNIIKEESDN